MEVPSPQVKNLENISQHFNTLTKHPQFSHAVFQSMEGLTQTLTAILEANGKQGWTARAVSSNGTPIFQANEGQQFEKQLEPFIPMILRFFDREATLTGGASEPLVITRDKLTELQSDIGRIRNKFATEPSQVLKTEYTTKYNELDTIIKQLQASNANHGITEQAIVFLKGLPNPSTLSVPPSAAPLTIEQELRQQLATVEQEKEALEKKLQTSGKVPKPFSLDRTILDTVKKIYKMDETTQRFASENMGILKFERDYDTTTVEPKDPHPFTALRPIPYVGPFLAEVPVPARLLVMIVYTILDVARVMISVSPVDSPIIRSVLSVLLAIADFLKGSWKKSILTLAGIFGQNYVLAGVVGKLLLDVISLISPDLQLKIALGMVDVIKSLTAGILLEIYQTIALAPMREPVIQAFDEIAELVKKNRAILAQVEGLNDDEDALPSFLIPSFTNIQNIQAVIAHDALVCTTEFQNAIDKMLEGSQGQKNTIMRFILEFLLRVPVDAAARQVRCPDMLQLSPQTSANQSGNINIENPVDTSGKQTYTDTATKASLKYSEKV